MPISLPDWETLPSVSKSCGVFFLPLGKLPGVKKKHQVKLKSYPVFLSYTR